MSRKTIIILTAIFVFLLLVILTLSLLTKKNTPAKQVSPDLNEQNKLSFALNNQTGATINGDGFEISYLDTEQTFVIAVTDNPFQGNIEKAKAYLEENYKVDITKVKYICSVVRGVTATEEEVTRCGNAVIK